MSEWAAIKVSELNKLTTRLSKLEAAADAAYYYLAKSGRTGVQPECILPCGHLGESGATMCRACAIKALAEAMGKSK